MKLEILALIIRLVIVIMIGVLLPEIRKWLAEKSENEKLNRVKAWAVTVVKAAEQLHNKAEKDDPKGTIRKEYAHRMINRLAMRLGICLSDKEIEALIESAVHEINDAGVLFVDAEETA